MLKYAVTFCAILAASVTLAEEPVIPLGGMLLPINTQCINPSDELTEIVKGKHSEQPFAEGTTNLQYVRTGEWVSVPFKLYVNPSSGGWSMIAFMPGGPGCLISSGEGFIPAVNTTY